MIDDVDSDDAHVTLTECNNGDGDKSGIEDVTRSPMRNAFKRCTTYE